MALRLSVIPYLKNVILHLTDKNKMSDLIEQVAKFPQTPETSLAYL